MSITLTLNDISMITGFVVGLFGSKLVDYVTNKYYYSRKKTVNEGSK